MMQCGARVDDERQVRSGVGNERDKAVYSAGGGGGEEGNQLSRGHCAGPSRPPESQLQAYSTSVRNSLTHTRERGREAGVPDWD